MARMFTCTQHHGGPAYDISKASNSKGWHVAVFHIKEHSSTPLDISAELARFRGDHSDVDDIGIINIYNEATDGSFCDIVPFDPSEWGCRHLSISQYESWYSKDPVHLNAKYLADSASLETLTQIAVTSGSDISQDLIDKTAAAPNMTHVTLKSNDSKSQNLHIPAPANATNMLTWGFELGAGYHTAEDWQSGSLRGVAFRNFSSFKHKAPADLLTSPNLRFMVLDDCPVGDDMTSAITQTAAGNTHFLHLVLSNNPEVTELPFVDEDTHYHIDKVTFGQTCAERRRRSCARVYPTDGAYRSYISHEGSLEYGFERYPIWERVNTARSRSGNEGNRIVESYGLTNLKKKEYPNLKGYAPARSQHTKKISSGLPIRFHRSNFSSYRND